MIRTFLLFTFCYAGENNFISDEWFSRTNITETQFLKFCSKFQGSLTDSHKMRVYGVSKYYGINPVVFLAKMQTESSVVQSVRPKESLDKCMGYGILYQGNHGFDTQIWRAAKLLYDEFQAYRPMAGMMIEAQRNPWDKKVKYFKPENAASYALTVYTPSWGMSEFDKDGIEHPCGGNRLFEVINEYYQNIFEKMK